ncbi:TRADD-N-associated membrane domain-containing protein [Streptomyces sp. TLI_185]|uniref:TRADD-N-associated membrane domain-containing protein n=1 Tax=Streptomyces sp. TLI_185 TaxID=2485151 RepID=UPI000F4FEA56|nr:hypothetical protein [Streptomyces sp. TLI_185]
MTNRDDDTEADGNGTADNSPWFSNTQADVIFGDKVVQIGNFNRGEVRVESKGTDHAAQRQTFLFDFLRQALKQAETTFRLSVAFMSGGAIILLVGGALALANAGNQEWSYLPVLTSLSGLLISSCGGAFALHSNRARKHLTEQAERIHGEMRADLTLEQTLSLIDRVDDVELRDRLKSVAAMRSLGFMPEASDVADRILPPRDESGRGVIEPPPRN